MKELDVAFPIIRKGIREELNPLLIKTTSHCVIFPDGKSLNEKWADVQNSNEEQNNINSGIVIGTVTESIYNWKLTSFNNLMYELMINVELSGRYILNSIFTGNTSHDNVGMYLMQVPLPSIDPYNNKQFDYENSSVFITENKSSDFSEEFILHNVYASIMNNSVQLEVQRSLTLDHIFLNKNDSSLEINLPDDMTNNIMNFRGSILVKGSYK